MANDSPTVTQLTSDVELTPPSDCCASVLLRLAGRDTSGTDVYFAWWVVAGRWGAMSATVPYHFDGVLTYRFDVPRGVRLSSDYLQPYLAAVYGKGGHLPTDTPVIKGAP
jgi:hypothetical protein